MKRIANWVSICGALLALYQGVRWLSDMSSELAQLAARILGPPPWAAAVVLVVAGVAGLAAAIITALNKGRPSFQGIALVVLGVAPLLFSARAVFVVPMVAGGLLTIVAFRREAARQCGRLHRR